MSNLCVFVFKLAILSLLHSMTNGDPSKIDPELLSSSMYRNNGDRANILVTFVDGIEPVLQRAAASRTLEDRQTHNQAVVDDLKSHAQDQQGGVLQLLSSQSGVGSEAGYEYFKSFWLGNKIFIKNANIETLLEIADDPRVAKIHKEMIIRIPQSDEPPEEEISSNQENGGIPEHQLKYVWGVKKIQAEEAWEELGGNKGEGVVVGVIDTGVDAEHEALKDNFVGIDYGWFDPATNSSVPIDGYKHGTHVIGTLAGKFGIGVAPGAKWMTCKGCGSYECPSEAILECFQWIACPTLMDGSNANCSKAPQVMSVSWSGERGATAYKDEILGWLELGIIPVFATGNQGILNCNNTEPPGEYPFVIGVGATNKDDYIWSGSSIGYASDGSIKPDIVAPGENVLSSIPPTPWNTYLQDSGSSMATPHVAGVIALLKVRQPNLTYQQAYDLLTQNTDQTVTMNPDVKYCNESNIDVFPNIYAGYGRVNALKAVQAQTAALPETRTNRRCQHARKRDD